MSRPTDDPSDRFGELCASLAVGRTARARLLEASGLEEATWATLCERWARHIRADRGAAERFGAAFASAVLAALSRRPNLDETLIGPSRPIGPVLPFRPTGSRNADTAAAARDPDATADMPMQALCAAALPFVDTSEKRLVRFDLETGRELPEPIRVDVQEQ